MAFFRYLTAQRRELIFCEMELLLVIIGIADYLTGFQVRLLPLYSVPVFAVAWFCGRRLGIVAGLTAGVISLAADWLQADPDLMGVIMYWEVPRHLMSCLVVALVSSALRNRNDIAAARISLLEHSHRLEREIIRISDAEQQRIGQDLHDGLCQYLAALGCSATSLQQDLAELQLEKPAAEAAELADLLQKAVVQTRDLAHGLVPAHVAQVGLSLAIESLADSVTRLQGIQCNFVRTGANRSMADTTAKHLYRIAQEAISNAIKHGKARRIMISLDVSDLRTILRIQDDGAGFDPGNIQGHGMGLNIMGYRARVSGGALRIEKPENGGTLIVCTAQPQAKSDDRAAA
jgi:signal transduction histidine kinase